MKTPTWFIAALTCVLMGAACPGGAAQKGLGDSTGIARENAKPDLVTLRGVLLKIETHRCEQTTGRASLETHLIIRGEGGQQINLHLGPSREVAHGVRTLKPGTPLKVRGFRTASMAPDSYVTVSLSAAGRTTKLRDSQTLRPVWAGGRRKGRG